MEKNLAGKRILVTGGAGFIGSHIVDKLVELGAEVTVLDNLITGKIDNIKHNLDKIKFIQKDLTDTKALDEALEGIDCISHQGALRSVPKSVEMPLEYHRVNVTGTLNLFLKAKEKGIKRIVFASSSSVYGERKDFPEKETDKPCPLSPYAATKLMGEEYAYIFSKLYDLEVISLRYFNVFGPRQSLENQYAVVVPKFIVCLLNDESPPIYGDGEQERDFTYVDNVVEANILSLAKPDISGQVFNVASANPQSVNGLLRQINEIMTKSIEAKYLDLRLGDVRKTYADITKLKNLLGHDIKVNFYDGLKKTVEWFKTRGEK